MVSIAEDESPPLKGTLEVDYIVLRRVNIRKGYVYVEFVDGDVRDGKEWFEGPVPEYMTIRALFEVRDEMNRGERREMYGREKLGEEVDHNVLTGLECECMESPMSSGDDKRVVRDAVESARMDGNNSEDTDENVKELMLIAEPRRSAGTRKRTSDAMDVKMPETHPDARKRTLRARDEKITKTCDDVHKSKAGGVDFPKPKFQKMETRSATRVGMK